MLLDSSAHWEFFHTLFHYNDMRHGEEAEGLDVLDVEAVLGLLRLKQLVHLPLTDRLLALADQSTNLVWILHKQHSKIQMRLQAR